MLLIQVFRVYMYKLYKFKYHSKLGSEYLSFVLILQFFFLAYIMYHPEICYFKRLQHFLYKLDIKFYLYYNDAII